MPAAGGGGARLRAVVRRGDPPPWETCADHTMFRQAGGMRRSSGRGSAGHRRAAETGTSKLSGWNVRIRGGAGVSDMRHSAPRGSEALIGGRGLGQAPPTALRLANKERRGVVSVVEKHRRRRSEAGGSAGQSSDEERRAEQTPDSPGEIPPHTVIVGVASVGVWRRRRSEAEGSEWHWKA